MIFTKQLATEGQTRLFTIEHSSRSGWIAREYRNNTIHTSLIHDWRRVEATMALFELKALALRNEGWSEVSAV